jgi:hypothetical protein
MVLDLADLTPFLGIGNGHRSGIDQDRHQGEYHGSQDHDHEEEAIEPSHRRNDHDDGQTEYQKVRGLGLEAFDDLADALHDAPRLAIGPE